MNYDSLHTLLKSNDIDCGKETAVFSDFINGFSTQTVWLYLTDDPVLLSPLKDRIENILLENKVKARVDIFPNDDKVTIKLI